MTTLLGSLTHDSESGFWRSKDGRWAFGRMEVDGRWYVWEDDSEFPSLGERFETLSDARSAVESLLRDDHPE